MSASFTRRDFLAALGATMSASMLPATVRAQQEAPQQPTGAANVPMNEDRYRPVRLPAKSPTPALTNAERDAVEHRLHCQCGCTLDVYTCRTTDFSCPVSPQMHADVMALVAGGYSAPEIIKAFTDVYGPRVLMAPPRHGFDLTGWITPFVVIVAGLALVLVLLRRWRAAAPAPAPAPPLAVDASPDEMARLDALVRSDDR